MGKYHKGIRIEGADEFLLAVNITGHGAPTEDTEAEPGMCYLDGDSEHGDLYKCIGVLVTETRTVYRWKKLAGQEEVERLSEAKVNGIGIKNLIALTQAEYDALEEKDDTTLYIITDATGEDSGGGNDTPTNMIPYLKSDGVAYVKLSHGHIDNATYEMCFRAENDLETNDAIFGNRYTNIAFKGGTKTDSWISGYYNGSNYATFGESTIDISNKHIYTITDTSLILDNDIVKEITAGTNTIYTQMYLFATNGSYQNNGEYVAGKSAFTFFYLKIRNSEGELIYNYQPAEDSEGVACIYEAVTKTYLYNVAESGGFVYGTELEES